MKKLPIGIQTFSEIINKNYVYVDKTAIIHHLITQGKVYFLARPRRFGKSLLVSTIQSIFEGKRELFKGLAIDDLDYNWKAHHVIRIDFSGINRDTPENFLADLRTYLVDEAQKYNVDVDPRALPSTIFRTLISGIYQNHGQVILLVDEYDKPILDHLKNPKMAEEMRTILRSFYDVFKYLDQYLHFVFITGVSKFTQTSIFSGMNNLHDISTTEQFATLCGYTKKEIEANFVPHIKEFGIKFGKTNHEVVSILEKWYDGYSFEWGCEKLFNPFSVLNALQNKKLGNYWIMTGTPNFLATMFKGENPLPQIDKELRVKPESLVLVSLEKLPFIPVLVQTGYLTLAGEDSDGYILDFPNQEVSQSYTSWSLASIANKEITDIYSLGITLRKTLKTKNFDSFFNNLISLFASIPFDIHVENREKYYQSMIYLIFLLVGIDMDVELSTNIGRIDAVVSLDDAIIIFEYKLDDTAQIALDQIKEKKYYERFLRTDNEIIFVGVQFGMQERNITSWLVESFDTPNKS